MYMTHISRIFGIVLFAFISSAITAQRGVDIWTPAVDTCDNAETITFTWSEVLSEPGSLELHIVSDSLSGANTGTVYIDHAIDESATTWVEVASDAFEQDTQTIYTWEDTEFSGMRVRVRVIGSGTQSTKVTVKGLFKRRRF